MTEQPIAAEDPLVPRPAIQVLASGVGLGLMWGAVLGIVIPGVLTAGIALLVFPYCAGCGAVVGGVCGSLGGLMLAVFRQQIGGDVLTARMVGGAGAAIPGLVVMFVFLTRATGEVWAIGSILAALSWGMGSALSPQVLYGMRPPKQKSVYLPPLDGFNPNFEWELHRIPIGRP